MSTPTPMRARMTATADREGMIFQQPGNSAVLVPERNRNGGSNPASQPLRPLPRPPVWRWISYSQ